jgi:hypothetical protein
MRSLNGVQAVVFVGTRDSVFVTRTRDFLTQNGVDVGVVDPYQARPGSRSPGIFAQATRVLARIKRVACEMRLRSPSETAVVHSLSVDVFWLIPLLKRRFRRVILICYGSDVLRRDNRFDWLLGIGLRRLDGIAATNHNVLDRLKEDFPYVVSLDHRIVRFGLPVFDALDSLEATSSKEAKRCLGFQDEETIVCLGYSAYEGQRQLELISFFAQRARACSNVQFIVPVQYGETQVVSSVKLACAQANKEIGRAQFRPLIEFHDVFQSALMRKSTDILVNHSVSDAFSGTVQEVVYSGNLVLAVSTLPYRTMPGFGSAIRTYDTLDDVAGQLAPDNVRCWRQLSYAAAASNRAELRKISSWEAVISDWEEFIVGPFR